MVFVCINHVQTGEQIQSLAKKKNILFNTSHKKELCDFHFPAVVLKNGAVIASSAQGKNHQFAKALRERLEGLDLYEN